MPGLLKRFLRRSYQIFYRPLKPIRLLIIPANSNLERKFLKAYRILFPESHTRIDHQQPIGGENPVGHLDFSDSDPYQRWIKVNEPTNEEMAVQRRISQTLTNYPLISIITPVYNPPLNVFVETAQSVINQSYPYWEWCLADASIDNPEIREYLRNLSDTDSRIRIKKLIANEGIAKNTNTAIAISRGDFVSFLDHDDVLAPFALYDVFSVIQNSPEVDLIYSDEDRLSEDGEHRYDPCFRPEFSPETLRSNNYMPHLITVSRSLGDTAGWLHPGFEGAQDHDFLLRCSECAIYVVHIAKILYHWRAITGSASLNNEAKPYAHLAGRRAIEEHLVRIHRNGKVVDGHDPNYHRAIYNYPKKARVSIILWAVHAELLEITQNINSLVSQTYDCPFEIIVAASEVYPEIKTNQLHTEQNAEITILGRKSGEGKYSLLNRAVGESTGEYLIFLHQNTTVIDNQWFNSLLELAVWPEHGVIGGMVVNSEGKIINVGYIIGGEEILLPIYYQYPQNWAGYFGMLKYPHDRSAFSDMFMTVRKSLFSEAGGFDPKYNESLGDIDLCLKIQIKGWRNLWTPYSIIQYSGSGINCLETDGVDAEYFQKKWQGYLARGDPNYNPNLSLTRNDYSIRTVHAT